MHFTAIIFSLNSFSCQQPNVYISSPEFQHLWYNIMCVINNQILSDVRKVCVPILVNRLKPGGYCANRQA